MSKSGRGGHPKNIVFLTADAFGVLPPVAKLSRDQAMYYFLSGYTAKVAGTERGVKEPQATFSSCFGAVFLVWHPTKYAEMLGKLVDEHGSDVWLVNTGWTGGAYGVGKRMKLGAHARDGSRAPPRRSRAGDDGRPIRSSGCRCRRSGRRSGRRPQAAQDVARQVGVRRAGEKAGVDVPDNFGKFEKFVDESVKNAGPKLAGRSGTTSRGFARQVVPRFRDRARVRSLPPPSPSVRRHRLPHRLSLRHSDRLDRAGA